MLLRVILRTTLQRFMLRKDLKVHIEQLKELKNRLRMNFLMRLRSTTAMKPCHPNSYPQNNPNNPSNPTNPTSKKSHLRSSPQSAPFKTLETSTDTTLITTLRQILTKNLMNIPKQILSLYMRETLFRKKLNEELQGSRRYRGAWLRRSCRIEFRNRS